MYTGYISGTFENSSTTVVWYNTEFLWQSMAHLSITIAIMSA